MDQRIQFIAALQQDPKGNFSKLCEQFGISRPTGYALRRRYNEQGAQAFENRHSVAHSCPHRTAPEVEDRIVALRKQRPTEGPKKIRARLLELEPQWQVPATSTIGDILDRRGLIRPRRAHIRVPPHPNPLEPCSAPNELWCCDFKGHFALGDKTRCHPLTVSDAASRFLLLCEGLVSEKEALVRPCFERAFVEFGLPERIRSDNGSPFASRSLGGLTCLSVWWIQLGILPERIEPGHPEQNPRHERMHKTLKQAAANPPATNLAEQQRLLDYFRADYNNDRPHEALGQTPPARHYEPSWRSMREPREPEYSEGFDVRRVSAIGHISLRGRLGFVGKPLAGQPLGLKPTDEDEWEVHYGPLLIGFALLRKEGLKLEPVT